MPSFPKKNRLRLNSDFQSLRQRGVPIGNRYFGVRWFRARGRRMGIVILKRVANAPQRNRIKRIIRECFRLEPERFPPGDFVILVKPLAGRLEKESIRHFLMDSLKSLPGSLKSL